MKKILAVSGGVDSMVMLDLMAHQFPSSELLVATFDHGTRETSREDADFVSRTASALRLKVYRGEARLGGGISEEEARKKRYEFLREIAEEELGIIYTAHHLDDLVESVAINLNRGTGIRGLAALNASDVKRPFIDGTFGEIWDKRRILSYAAKNGIAFRQDPTNTSEVYLRNRLREKMRNLPLEAKMKLFRLWEKQKETLAEIDEIIEGILPNDLAFERSWFEKLDDNVAIEILRASLIKSGVSATRPQINNFLEAIREYEPGKQFNLPGDRLVRINKRDFRLEIW